MARRPWKRQIWPAAGGVVVVLLAAIVITLGSFNPPLRPEQGNAFAVYFALNVFMGAALLVFALILFRTLLRLWAERRRGQIGSRFKFKMVAGAVGVSFLPLVFLFFFSYAIVNRTLNTWFPRPLEIANEQSRTLLNEFTASSQAQGSRQAEAVCQLAVQKHMSWAEAQHVAAPGADAIWLSRPDGAVVNLEPAGPALGTPHRYTSPPSLPLRTAIWTAANGTYAGGEAPCLGGALVVAQRIPDDFLARNLEIESQTNTYMQQKQRLRAYKRYVLVALALLTLLLVFTTIWVALFLSKQVTVPIQALAEATREISRGNFDHRIALRAQDELEMLIRSFNRMSEQLGEGRRQINEFTRSLEQAVEERERRRKVMEAILEHIPTGVLSLDESGRVTQANAAAVNILGDRAREARTLQDLLGEEGSRAMLHLMRRSLRMGAASREIEIPVGGRLLCAAVTVSSLGPRRANPGFVVVIDDLTDLLRAQKAAAWQEVAQRVAHEIKNPLTPIQLSAQRMRRYLERSGTFEARRTDFEKLAAECSALIEREVRTLESLVDEFSQFARFPAARLALADVNAVVESALGIFRGRLDGVTVQTELAASLPPVKLDAELMRHVLVNLIDNAAEAMEGAALRRLRVATRTEGDGDAVIIDISDSGHGISPADKEKLFLPHFSTKQRGTGLGLAIASRIIAEHNGSIRAEDNLPSGSRFVIRFPAAEAPVPAQT